MNYFENALLFGMVMLPVMRHFGVVSKKTFLYGFASYFVCFILLFAAGNALLSLCCALSLFSVCFALSELTGIRKSKKPLINKAVAVCDFGEGKGKVCIGTQVMKAFCNSDCQVRIGQVLQIISNDGKFCQVMPLQGKK